MAFRRRFKKRRFRRRTRKFRRFMRRRRRLRPSKLKLRGVSMFPDMALVKLKFVVNDVYSSQSDFVRRVFAMNDMATPDLDNPGGGWPLGLTQWSQFYTRWIVFASKIRVTITCMTSTENMNMCLYPSTDNTFPTTETMTNIREYPYARYVVTGQGNAGNNMKVCKSYMSIKKLEGNPRAYMDTGYTGFGTSGNPTVKRYWVVGIDSVDTAGTWDCTLHTQITYYVRFYIRKDIAPSTAVTTAVLDEPSKADFDFATHRAASEASEQ